MKKLIRKILINEVLDKSTKPIKIKTPKNEDDIYWNKIVDLYLSGKVKLCEDVTQLKFWMEGVELPLSYLENLKINFKGDDVKKHCNCVNGIYVRDKNCEMAYSKYYLDRSNDKKAYPPLKLQPDFKTLFIKLNGGKDEIVKNKYNSGSLTISEDDTSYTTEPTPYKPTKNFQFYIYGDILTYAWKLTEPNIYKFNVGEFFKMPEEQEADNLYDMGKELLKKGTKKIISKIGLYDWELTIKFYNFNVEYGSGENVDGANISLDVDLLLTNSGGYNIVKISSSSNSDVSLSKVTENKFNVNLDKLNLNTKNIEVTPTGVGAIDKLFSPETISIKDGILWIEKEYMLTPKIEIPIDISDSLKLNFDVEIPVPESIPFEVDLLETNKKVAAKIKNTKLTVNKGTSYVGDIIFDSPMSTSQEGGNETNSTTKTNKEEKNNEVKINESVNEDVVKEEIVSTIDIKNNVLQGLINFIGPVIIYKNKKVSDITDKNILPDALKEFLWAQLENTKISIVISNIKIGNISESIASIGGVLTMYLTVIDTEIIKQGKRIVGFNSKSANKKVKKSVPFIGSIKIQNEGDKVITTLSNIKFNIHKFFNLGVKDNGKEIVLVPSINYKDEFNTSMDFGSGNENPLIFEYEIPTLENKDIKIEVGKKNKKEITIIPSNEYGIELKNESVFANSSVDLVKKK